MQEVKQRLLKDDTNHLEDLVMKTAAQYFGEELLTWLGVTEEPVRPAPTEIIHLEARKLYEDFLYEMKDGSWYHFEFESDALTDEDLRRFREYEASTSRTYGVNVITCVLCSAHMKKPKDRISTGIGEYRVMVIQLKDQDANGILEEIRKKSHLERKDLISILLSPLMSGTMTVKNRILEGLHILREKNGNVDQTELGKTEAMLYALANKFLKRQELEEVKEAIRMTVLGQMLRDDGIKEGMEKGLQQGIQQEKARYNQLILKLAEEGKSGLLIEAAADPELLEKLFAKYQI